MLYPKAQNKNGESTKYLLKEWWDQRVMSKRRIIVVLICLLASAGSLLSEETPEADCSGDFISQTCTTGQLLVRTLSRPGNRLKLAATNGTLYTPSWQQSGLAQSRVHCQNFRTSLRGN